MKPLNEYFNDDEIIGYLCQVRTKLAHQRNRKHLLHLLTSDKRLNYHLNEKLKTSEYENQLLDDLAQILPSRRKWKDLGQTSRYKNGNRTSQPRTSIEKNKLSLTKTINYYRKHRPSEEFFVKLTAFIADIRNLVNDPNYRLKAPEIYPKRPSGRRPRGKSSGDDETVCRPISLFLLKDRVILGLMNRYLTDLLDPCFLPCSFAFRAKQKLGSKSKQLSHHDTIVEILKYVDELDGSTLWVAECDIQKFYDSVNHKVIIRLFDELIVRVSKKHPGLDLDVPKRVLLRYLESYSFNENVMALNQDANFWLRHGIENGRFGWVESEFLEKRIYFRPCQDWSVKSVAKNCFYWLRSLFVDCPNISKQRIGIPQGGALSGLIANVVLHSVDTRLQGIHELLYVRFCDDMIAIDYDENRCESAISLYETELRKLKLLTHPRSSSIHKSLRSDGQFLEDAKDVLKSFWNAKSKGPFKWDDISNGGFPWIGFVGYEIHRNGALRIRKSSLMKELNKQRDVIQRIERAIADRRVSIPTILESAISRLIGMSVGRVKLWNSETLENELCWKQGFRELGQNQHLIRQLKTLDRSRNKLFYDLKRDLNARSKEDENLAVNTKNTKKRKTVRYDKPFSYYHQVYDRGKRSD